MRPIHRLLATALFLGLWACGGGTATTPAAPAPAIDPALYLTLETGTLPVILSAPHGGLLAISGIPERSSGVTTLDTHTFELSEAIQTRLVALTGRKAHRVAALVSRKYVDFNRSADQAYETAAVGSLYQAYHTALASAVQTARSTSSAGALLVDLHGQGTDPTLVFRGTREGITADLTSLYASNGFLGTLVSGGTNLSPATSATAENPSYNGGYIVATYGRSGVGGISAVQLEFGLSYRNTISDIEATATKVAEAIVAHLRAQGAL